MDGSMDGSEGSDSTVGQIRLRKRNMYNGQHHSTYIIKFFTFPSRSEVHPTEFATLITYVSGLVMTQVNKSRSSPWQLPIPPI